MKIFRSVSEMQQAALELRAAGKTLGCVPTMGYLHEGHLSLVRASKAANEITVVTVFVNPTQFGPNEDLGKYPRDEERDLRLLEDLDVDWVFIPSMDEIYPAGFSTYVEPPQAAQGWCGASRPVHFRGVCTVVLILFNILQPSRAYFGQKDAQQCAVVKSMVRDFRLPMEFVICPTVREPDGLAMSSRNVYLSEEGRKDALVLSQTLRNGLERYRKGEQSVESILSEGRKIIEGNPEVKLDYLGIVDENNFKPVEKITRGNFYIGAIYAGKTRLIDNMIFQD